VQPAARFGVCVDMSVWPLRYSHGQETVEAFRRTGDATQRDEPQCIVDALQEGGARIVNGGTRGVKLAIQTPEGWSTSVAGDWIVRWPSGHLEVCSDKLFRKRCAAFTAALPRTKRSRFRGRDLPSLSRPIEGTITRRHLSDTEAEKREH
jgi:hypothetical protein